MPTRLVREGINSSDRVASLGWAAEVFYRRVMLVVDDFGRFDGRPTLLRAACYPTLVDSVSDSDVEGWLWQCVDAELIQLYSVNGKNFIQLHDFGEPRAKKSKWPAPDDKGAESVCKQMQTDANKCLQTQTDANECAQMQAYENKCKQMQASAPYSYSSSDSSANSDSSPNAQSPPPPSGERRRETFDPMGIDFPDAMQTDGFPEAWARWVSYRQEITPRLKPKSWQAQAAQFIRYGPQAGVMAIDQSIASGWRGVFPDKCSVERQLGFRGPPLESKAEIRRREEAEARRKLEEWAREGES